MYVGITCRKPKKRIDEHKRSGKDFDKYAIEQHVPNLYSLADIEYWVLLYLSRMIPSIHLINKVAGGNYRLPDMARAGVLYLLLHFNSILPGDESDDTRDFADRYPTNFRRNPANVRRYAVLTTTRHLELPKFNKKTSLRKIFTLLGYQLAETREERAQKRTTGIKCNYEDCPYFAETELALASHVYKKHKGLSFPCTRCTNILSSNDRLRNHMKTFHQVIVPLADKKKPLKEEYPCTFKDCKRVFKSREDMHAHWVKHRDYVHQCQDCPRSFHRSVDLRHHMKAQHGKELPFQRDIKPETKHKCILCTKKDRYYATQASLRTHYERVHKMKKVDETLRKMKEESDRAKKK
jgi:hypothetical protein